MVRVKRPRGQISSSRMKGSSRVVAQGWLFCTDFVIVADDVFEKGAIVADSRNVTFLKLMSNIEKWKEKKFSSRTIGSVVGLVSPLELTNNHPWWTIEEGAWCQKSRRCPVCVARCPHCPAQLCRLPGARPNLTKPVTALLPYVPICAKQIWMENSSGDARKVGNTGFTCDADARKLGQLQISNVW